MKHYFLSTIMLMAFGVTAFAQETSQPEKTEKVRKHSIGLGAGFTSGLGLTYRYMPSDIGVQLVAGGYKSENESLGSGGITFLYRLLATEKANFFTYYSNSVWYRQYSSYNYYSSYDPALGYYRSYYQDKEKTTWNTGLGLGLEILAGNKVGFSFMLGWAGYDTFNLILPTAETSILIKF